VGIGSGSSSLQEERKPVPCEIIGGCSRSGELGSVGGGDDICGDTFRLNVGEDTEEGILERGGDGRDKGGDFDNIAFISRA